jgi:hypothetical protein
MTFKKEVVCTWSGGVDSTALIALLLRDGYKVNALTLNFYERDFVSREARSRKNLLEDLSKLGDISVIEKDGSFLWSFSPDGVEIPRRNRLIIDHLIETECKPRGLYYLGVGEYIGADTWVVRDHVGSADADARALTSYIYQEYGLDFRLLTLADFGESRYKSDRVALGASVIGDLMFKTTNCLNNVPEHCGECYKCVERHVSFTKVFGRDETVYLSPPRNSERYRLYLEQMKS